MDKTNITNQETRPFRMHQKLLLDVIQRQAGSLSKGVLEGLMNAVDAKATRCSITLDADELLIEDDGAGFGSKENIVKFFEVFGRPHEEHEKKTYGTFRLGRGQLFAFGANLWKTGRWQMDVDIQGRGLDYQLTEGEQETPGCQVHVRLYEPLNLTGMDDVRRDLKKWCKWAPIHVTLNGDQISNEAAQAKWDHVTDEAYVRLSKSGSLSVYNLGIHVCELPAYKFGCGGEVVSRKQLRVNFARNDIISDCTVWRKVRPFINQQATDRNLQKRSLDDDGRERLADQIRSGELSAEDCRGHKLFTAVTGRHFSAEQIIHSRHRYRCYSAAPLGDRKGDDIMRSEIAFIFAGQTLERFGCKDVPALLKWIKGKFDRYKDWKPVYTPFAKLAEQFADRCTIVPEDKLRPQEKLWLSILERAACRLRVDDQAVYGWHESRRVVVGEADLTAGWTDGRSYTAVNRKFLAAHEPDVGGLAALGCLLAHEACHESDSFHGHDHDQAFYERFHDCVSHCLGDFLKEAQTATLSAARNLNRGLKRKLDKQAEAQKQVESVQKSAAQAGIVSAGRE